VIPIRALFYGLADGVPVLAQRFFRWPPNKALRNEAANNHFMLTRARESRLVEALPICSGERHRILGSKAKGAKKYSDGMRDAGLSSGDITRESSGGESLSGSGNARVLFAGRRRPK